MTSIAVARSGVTHAPPEARTEARGVRPRLRARVWFWVRRYAPAEVACLITMLIASIAAAQLTQSPLFYLVSGVWFRITERTGIRMPRLRLRVTS